MTVSDCCLIKSLSYILFEKCILALEPALCQLYRHTSVPCCRRICSRRPAVPDTWDYRKQVERVINFSTTHRKIVRSWAIPRGENLHSNKIGTRESSNNWWLGSRVVSVLDSGAEGPGFKSQPRHCRVTVLGKLFTPILPLFTKQQNW